MSEHFRQENASFFSPLTESSSHEEISELEEEPDQRRTQTRKEGVCQCLARYRPLRNEESP